jgi:hypothetical protein
VACADPSQCAVSCDTKSADGGASMLCPDGKTRVCNESC